MLAVAILLLAFFAQVQAGRIISYNYTVITPSATVIPRWATYVQPTETGWKRQLNSSTNDDSQAPDPVGFCIPFIGPHHKVPLYSDSNGFISTVPFPLCSAYCTQRSSQNQNLYYNYEFVNDSKLWEGGGTWPIFGFYVTDLNPSAVAEKSGLGIYARRSTDAVEGFEIAQVDYRAIPPYQAEGTTSDVLTGQAEFWENGTVIYRYRSIFSESALSALGRSRAPSVGIVMSKLQRVIVDRNLFISRQASPPSVAAIRFDPFFDPCEAQSACESCVQQTPTYGSCVWCRTSSLNGTGGIRGTPTCVHSSVVDDYCGILSQLSSASVCAASHGMYPGEFPNSTQQRFYDIKIFPAEASVAGSKVKTVFPNLVDAQTDNTHALFGHVKELSNITTYWPALIYLPFNMSVFNFPANSKDVDEPTKKFFQERETDLIYGHFGGFFSLLNMEPQCSERNACRTGTLPFALFPYVTLAELTNGTHSGIIAANLSSGRIPGEDPFCFNEVASNGICGEAVVVQLHNIVHSLLTTANPPHPPSLNLDIQAVFLPSGTIYLRYIHVTTRPWGDLAAEKTCTGTELWDTAAKQMPFWPNPRVGLNRHSYADNASAMVSSVQLRVGEIILFSPVVGCPDCENRGYCGTNHQCQCLPNYKGSACRQCAAGFFGEACAPCRDCFNGGTCEDGIEGYGRCFCADPWGGPSCNVTCAAEDPRPLNCPNCNPLGGVCDCGRCICYTEKGWSGTNCDQWKDPCQQLSLDGCTTCLQYSHAQCVYCSAPRYTCLAAHVAGVPSANYTQCDAITIDAALAASPLQCTQFRYPPSNNSGFNIIIVVSAFVLLSLMACVGVLAMCCCRKVPPNPMVVNAVIGWVEYQRPRRERETVQVQFAPIARRTKLVQGIPLKQIPLKELYEWQRQNKMSQPNDFQV